MVLKGILLSSALLAATFQATVDFYCESYEHGGHENYLYSDGYDLIKVSAHDLSLKQFTIMAS